MMRPLTAFGVYYIRPSLYPAKFSGYPAKLPFPRWGPFAPFLVSRQEKEKNKGFAPLSRVKTRRRTGALPLYPHLLFFP